MKNASQNSSHWSNQEESVKTNRPILLMLFLIKIFPNWIVNALVYPISFFFYLGASRARKEIRRFQKNLRDYTNGQFPKKLSEYKPIFSFSLCLVERIEGWVGKINEKNLIFQNDDFEEYKRLLVEEKKGVFVFGSHLGNLDLLRSLSTVCRVGVDTQIPVTVIMEIKTSENFSNTLKKINPDYEFTAIDPKDIGPETVIELQEKLSRGEVVVVTGDRTSAHSRNRFIRKDFLGKKANFPYGVFLLAALVHAPVFYIFGARKNLNALCPKNNVHVEKSEIEFSEEDDRKTRNKKMEDLCQEFVSKLEKFACMYPYQWYNFFDFWDDGLEDKVN